MANNMQSQHTGMAALPRELLDRVASFLPTTDFSNLRLSCRAVESKVFPYWSNSFIRKKQFMISELSLKTLLAISEHPTLSRCLKHLLIGLDEFASVSPYNLTSLSHYQEHQASVCSQSALLDSGAAVTLLARALARLPNLESINIRDFNSPTRYRDTGPTGAATEWRSYGSSEYRGWDGHRSHIFPVTNNFFAVRVFRAVLAAASLSKCRPYSFEVTLRHRYGALCDAAFAPLPTMTDECAQFLRGLTKLHIDLGMTRDNFGAPTPHAWQRPNSANLTSAEAFWDPETINLRRFLAQTSQVTHLRMNFVQYHARGSVNEAAVPRFIQWLTLKPGQFADSDDKPGWSHVNPAPILLPLRQLDLGDICLDVTVLTSLLKKFTELNTLSLKAIGLASKHNSDSQDGGPIRESATWARFLRELLSITPKLRRMTLRRIQEFTAHGAPNKDILFLRPGEFPKVTDKTTTRDIYNVDQAALDRLVDSMWTFTDWARVHQPDLLQIGEDTEIYVEEGEETDEIEDEDDVDLHGVDDGSSDEAE
ncbi:hypothetical protein BD289DRAFT_44170 [Coniella lustricola]|uniref:F-box domain-containing protein n=1 Tax=Coniella lustricola TaxID=2025994 RepID=A0A2T3A1S3_9PEZI|nr:hypothetical protein BD289DRAFT_44170 [Coniella lustricola]